MVSMFMVSFSHITFRRDTEQAIQSLFVGFINFDQSEVPKGGNNSTEHLTIDEVGIRSRNL